MHHRWISIVFQHWNPQYFEAILEEAAGCGASLKASVTQAGDIIWSMHKKKNTTKVLAGEMILTFLYDGKGAVPSKGIGRSIPIDKLIEEAIREIAPDGSPFPGELLFNRVVLAAWQQGALGSLDLTREEFSEILARRGWRYNRGRHEWVSAAKGSARNYELAF